LTNVNGTLFFTANDGINGSELWKSNGTTAGTVLVKDIYAGADGSYPSNLTNVNGTLFFAGAGPEGGLWKSDRTEAGTSMLAGVIFGSNLTNVEGTLFFTAYDWTNGMELWKSDGTASGTTLVKDILPGYSGTRSYGYYPNSSYPGNLTNVNGTLFFTALGELWQSDGTEAGTVLVQDINPGYGGSYPASLTNVNGTLFFAADDGIHGGELWKASPGTSLGLSGFPANITAGAAGSFTVTTTNPDGSTNTGYQGTVHFTSSDSQAVLPAD